MRYVFVTGLGRSGTTWLTRLLQDIPSVETHHEYIGDKWFTVLSRYLPPDHHTAPFLERKKEEIDRSLQNGKTFIDVNNYLRYAVPTLREVFEGCAVYHLVRDPRTCVPSLYLRRGESVAHTLPVEATDIEWLLDADMFEQVCWTWTDSAQRLIEQGTELLLFERLLCDYDYLRRRLLAPLGLRLSESEWRAKKDVRVNQTRSKLIRYLYAEFKDKQFVGDKLPPYKKWSTERKQTLERICGELRRQIGYDDDWSARSAPLPRQSNRSRVDEVQPST